MSESRGIGIGQALETNSPRHLSQPATELAERWQCRIHAVQAAHLSLRAPACRQTHGSPPAPAPNRLWTQPRTAPRCLWVLPPSWWPAQQAMSPWRAHAAKLEPVQVARARCRFSLPGTALAEWPRELHVLEGGQHAFTAVSGPYQLQDRAFRVHPTSHALCTQTRRRK